MVSSKAVHYILWFCFMKPPAVLIKTHINISTTGKAKPTNKFKSAVLHVKFFSEYNAVKFLAKMTSIDLLFIGHYTDIRITKYIKIKIKYLLHPFVTATLFSSCMH
jgi:hypothetical protein